MLQKPGITTQNFEIFEKNFKIFTRLLVSQGDGSEQISLPHGVVNEPQYKLEPCFFCI